MRHGFTVNCREVSDRRGWVEKSEAVKGGEERGVNCRLRLGEKEGFR